MSFPIGPTITIIKILIKGIKNHQDLKKFNEIRDKYGIGDSISVQEFKELFEQMSEYDKDVLERIVPNLYQQLYEKQIHYGPKYKPLGFPVYERNGEPVRRWEVIYTDGSTWWGFLSKNWKPHGYGKFTDPQGNLIPNGTAGFWDDGEYLGTDPAYERVAFNKGFLAGRTEFD